MRTDRLRRLLREGGLLGFVLVGLYVLVHILLRRSRRSVLFFTAVGLIAAIACSLLFVLKADLCPNHVHISASPTERDLPSAKDVRLFTLDYRLPTSREGNSVAVVGTWQERGENLPHSCALWTLDPFSGQAHRLSYGPLVSYQMDWQAGGNRLAFTGNSFVYAGADIALPLCIADLQSGRKIEVVVPESEKWYISRLRWSPDGKWLAYNRAIWPYKYGTTQDLGTWIVSADGRQHFRLPISRSAARFELVGWRPGTSELYVTEGYPYAHRRLWLCSLTGEARELSAPATWPEGVEAPRTGGYICVRTMNWERPSGIHQVHSFTADAAQSVDLGTMDQTCDARWSGDGKWLAVANRRATAGEVTVCLLQGDGTHQKQIIAGYGEGYDPTTLVWSPDGRRLLVKSQTAYLVNAERGASTRFNSDFSPCSWRADGRLIGIGYNRVAILSQSGKVEKIFPPETFLGAE